MSEAMSGRPFPLTIKLGDIASSPDGWRQFTLTLEEVRDEWHQRTASSGEEPEEEYLTAFGPLLLNFTRGQTFRSAGQTYMVAYRPSLSNAELKGVTHRDKAERLKPLRLPGDTKLSLALINLASVSNLSGIAPFDSSLMLPALTPAQRESEASVSNLKQIGLALMQYTQDYDDYLPPMTHSATKAQITNASFGQKYPSSHNVQECLIPYVPHHDKKVFLQPHTGTPYQPNGLLSYHCIIRMGTGNRVPDSTTMVAFYEAAPDADQKRAVLFLDGHAARINESEWPRLCRASRITVTLTGAAALYYVYKVRQSAASAQGAMGKYYLSMSTGRVYYRNLNTGAYQWVGPPFKPLSVLYQTAAKYGLSAYQGYNGSHDGRKFGGYGYDGNGGYTDTVPATL